MRYVVWVLGFWSLLLPLSVGASEMIVRPSSFAVLSDDGDGEGDIVLARYSIPDEALNGRIVRATIWAGVDCVGGGGITVWTNPAPADWDPGSVDRAWWLGNKAQMNEKEVSQFVNGDCATGVVKFEVSRWAREWASGARPNLGVVLRSPGKGAPSFALREFMGVTAPILRITFRP